MKAIVRRPASCSEFIAIRFNAKWSSTDWGTAARGANRWYERDVRANPKRAPPDDGPAGLRSGRDADRFQIRLSASGKCHSRAHGHGSARRATDLDVCGPWRAGL